MYSPRRPAVWAGLLVTSGVLVAPNVPQPALMWLAAAVAATSGFLIIALFRRSAIWCVLALIATGVARMWLITAPVDPVDIRNAVDSRGRMVIYGQVAEEPDVRPHITQLVVALDSVSTNGARVARTGRVLIRFKFDPVVSIGDRLGIRGRLASPERARNPGQFDYADYLARRGVHMRLEPDAWAPIVSRTPSERPGWTRNVVAPLRTWLKVRLHRHLSEEPASLVWGLLFGEKQSMSPRTLIAFERTGTLHLLAVSGSNVGVVVAVIWGVLTFVRVRGRVRIGLAMLGVVLFCNLAHNEASVVRASVAAILVLAGRAAGRPSDALSIWGGSLLVLLLHDPRQVFNVGFQLSYLATLGILLVVPWCRVSGSRMWPVRATRFILAALAVSVAAQLAALPVLAAVFHRVPIITPVSNLLCVPLAGVVTAAGVVMLLLAPLGEPLGSVLGGVTWLSACALQWAVFLFDGLNWPLWEAATPGRVMLIGYVAGLLGLVVFLRKPLLRRRVLMVAGVLILGLVWGAAWQDDGLEIIVMDAGRRNCSLIRWRSGEVWQISAGATEHDERLAELVARALLDRGWELPARRLELARTSVTSIQDAPEPAITLYGDGSGRMMGMCLIDGNRRVVWLDRADRLGDPAIALEETELLICPEPDRLPDAFAQPRWCVFTGRRGQIDWAQDSAVQILLTRTHGAVHVRLGDAPLRVKPTIR